MSSVSSKIELLYMINDLRESGNIDSANKLQHIFLESLADDKKTGLYSKEVLLDRKDKKTVTVAKSTLRKSPVHG
ncbi:hypothetical protein [Agarivorans sp. Z349TD_8]|uniref:hypothetical protein n=1 Tax=Agarivorans sp. Z349TD_8 TaxID=3421434 RepID=UPI003D7E49C5